MQEVTGSNPVRLTIFAPTVLRNIAGDRGIHAGLHLVMQRVSYALPGWFESNNRYQIHSGREVWISHVSHKHAKRVRFSCLATTCHCSLTVERLFCTQIVGVRFLVVAPTNKPVHVRVMVEAPACGRGCGRKNGNTGKSLTGPSLSKSVVDCLLGKKVALGSIPNLGSKPP